MNDRLEIVLVGAGNREFAPARPDAQRFALRPRAEHHEPEDDVMNDRLKIVLVGAGAASSGPPPSATCCSAMHFASAA